MTLNAAQIAALKRSLDEEIIADAFAREAITNGQLADRLIRERGAASDLCRTALDAIAAREAAEAETARLAKINAKLTDNFNTLLIDGARLQERAEAAERERDALRKALRDIARQKKTDELVTELEVEYADFEGGYDACIDVARAALKEIPK